MAVAAIIFNKLPCILPGLALLYKSDYFFLLLKDEK
jgi:hypothetical protein